MQTLHSSRHLSYRYYFGKYLSELAELVRLPYSRGRSTRYSDRLHDIPVTIPRCYTNVYVNSFFQHKTRLWVSLPIECFPFTNDYSGFEQISFNCRFILNRCPVCFNLLPFCASFSCKSSDMTWVFLFHVEHIFINHLYMSNKSAQIL